MPGRESFPRRERLTSPNEFRDVFEHGRKAVGKAFVCYVVRREGQGRKLGMAVSRKVGGAITRNRVKRYIREFYRTSRDCLDEDTRIVVVARPGAGNLSFAECQDELRQVIRQGGAWSE